MEVDSLKLSGGHGSITHAQEIGKTAPVNTEERKLSDVKRKEQVKQNQKSTSALKPGHKNQMVVNSNQKPPEEYLTEDNLDKEYIGKVLEEANKKIFGTNKEFSYSVHEQTNRMIVQVLDSETKEVIKEIPPEKTLNALAKMWELAGLIIDEKL